MGEALRLYEERRGARTASVVRRSRLLGRWSYQLENHAVCALRDAAFKNVLSLGQLRQLDPVLGYEV